MLSVGKVMTKVFGSRNDRLLKRYRRMVEQVNAREPEIAAKTDAQLRALTQELRQQVTMGQKEIEDVLAEGVAIMRESMDRHIGIREIFNPEQHFDPDRLSDPMLELYDSVQRKMIETGVGYQQVEIPHPLYAAVRELYPDSRPPFRARCFDVQIIGGLVLYEGKIAEMKTGEGKTFVAPLAAFLRALMGQHTHVVTVNDYLVRRDALWVRPAFENVGLTVGFLQATLQPGAQTKLAEVARILTKYPRTIVEITGNTDSRGSAAMNEELSQQRAQAVADALIANGVSPSRIMTRGLGYTNVHNLVGGIDAWSQQVAPDVPRY